MLKHLLKVKAVDCAKPQEDLCFLHVFFFFWTWLLCSACSSSLTPHSEKTNTDIHLFLPSCHWMQLEGRCNRVCHPGGGDPACNCDLNPFKASLLKAQGVIGHNERQQQARVDVELRPRPLAALVVRVWRSPPRWGRSRMRQTGRTRCADAAPRR